MAPLRENAAWNSLRRLLILSCPGILPVSFARLHFSRYELTWLASRRHNWSACPGRRTKWIKWTALLRSRHSSL